MNISYNWLKEYIDTDYNARQVADMLTFSGLEVESTQDTESIKGGLDKYFIGKVLTCEKHPNSDHLHITTVDVGKQEPLHIVCGAPNVAAGQLVVVATIGAKVYDNDDCFEIKKSKLRGEVSEGMICSAKELQLSDDNSGILVLEDGLPGTPANEYFKIKHDTILTIGLTANRSDATSHIGVARDLAAIISCQDNKKIELKIPSVEQFKVDSQENDIKITIDENLCGRYSGICISSVEVKESPSWLKEHLNSVGIRPINNIVDVTNFVLMEIGQPLHSFDLDKIKGNTIEVKTLPKDTKFVTLDSLERKLNGQEAMVCNAVEPMCMAGIFGGKDSSITNETKNVFIESAYFVPSVIRKAAKYHQLSTDASFRYERGCDPNITIYALKRAAMLIQSIAGGRISSDIIDVYPKKVERASIDLSFNYLDSLVGQKIERDKIRMILEGLNIEIQTMDDNHLVALVPTNKVDVTRACDIVEEILRIYGYNNIATPQSVKSSLSYTPKPDREKIQTVITYYLADNGFNETMNNSLTPISYYQNNEDYPIEQSVHILNPLSSDLALMRQTLLYGGLESVAFNLNHKISNIKIFEFGNCYKKNIGVDDNLSVDKRYNQTTHLSIMLCGKSSEDSWQVKPKDLDFFYLKNIVYNVLRRLRLDTSDFVQQPKDVNFLSEGITLVNKQSNKVAAILGKVSTEVLKTFDIKAAVYYADIYWDNVIKMMPKKEIQYASISKYPSVRRDLALILDKDISFEQVETIVKGTNKKLIKDVNLFDVYTSLKEVDKKQYAISLMIEDDSKTLTDKQIESVVNSVVKALGDKLGARLR